MFRASSTRSVVCMHQRGSVGPGTGSMALSPNDIFAQAVYTSVHPVPLDLCQGAVALSRYHLGSSLLNGTSSEWRDSSTHSVVLRLLLSVEASRPTAGLCKWSRTRDRVVLPTDISCCLFFSPSHRASASEMPPIVRGVQRRCPLFSSISPPRGLSASVRDVYLKKQVSPNDGAVLVHLFPTLCCSRVLQSATMHPRFITLAAGRTNHTKMGSSACNRSCSRPSKTRG